MSKLKEISTDLKQFEEILKIIPDERKTIAQKLITEICFMTKTLEDLRKTIEENKKTGPLPHRERACSEG